MNKLLPILLLLCATISAHGQTMVNPQTQVRWPVLTGTVNPAAPAFPCTAAQYGMPYVNLATNTIFNCSTSGWVAVGGTIGLAGDVTGPSSATVLSKLQGTPLSCGSVGAGFVPVYQTSGNEFTCRQLTGNDIAPAFAITSFTCSTCGTYEVGQTVASPTNFTAAYNSPPTGASISDGTNTDTLTSPFTSGSLAHSYVLNSTGQINYVLTATGASTQTATQSSNWLPRSFGGVGASGATGTVTASGTSAVLSTGDVLANVGLATSNVGHTYGPYAPSGQKIYLLIIGTGHTFKDASTGFSFAFNTPTAVSFVNDQGATVTMELYESTNTLSGTFSVLVAS